MKLAFTTTITLASFCLPGAVWAESVASNFIPVELKTTNSQSEAKGFIEDQTLKGNTRNWYSHEHATKAPIYRYFKDGRTERTDGRTNWVQGTVLNYTSGFTQGAVGFGVEVAGYNTVALERDKDDVAGPNNRTLTHSDSDVIGQWSKIGLGNAKARVSNTTLIAGRQAMFTPVLAIHDNRALPSSFQGVSFVSEEFSNLTFKGGSFDRVSPRTEQSVTKFRAKYASQAFESDRVNMGGVEYKPFKGVKVSGYASNVEDFCNQYYGGVIFDWGNPTTIGLNTAISYYKTEDSGARELGDIDNQTYSIAQTFTHQAHAVSLGWQQVNGNEYFDYLNETYAIYLANAMYSDYNGPNEKSFRMSYAFDAASLGVPGLKLNAYTVRGWGIDGTHYEGTAYNVRNLDNAKHEEWGVGMSYVLQSGLMKDTAVRATYVQHSGSGGQIDGNVDELRIVTNIPFKIF
jgi:hypothetical protein